MRQRLTILLLVITTLLNGAIYAKEIVPIDDINTSPINFDGKKIWLNGIAKEPTRVPFLNLKRYVLEDDSGQIGIFTSEALPNMQKNITVRVRVESLAIIGGKPLGMTVVELERHEQ